MIADTTRTAVVETFDLAVSYGRIRALQNVSLTVRKGGVTALVGPNGAGKSTLLKTIAGIVTPRQGRVEIPSGTDVAKVPAHRRVRDLGLVLVPEGRGVFGDMSVEENLELGLRVGRQRREDDAVSDADALTGIFELFGVLEERRRLQARYLSGGEQQMLSLSRALLMEPSILLIDEPSMGLAPMLILEIFETLKSVLAVKAITVFLVEQDTRLALSVADWAYVLERGSIEASGTAAEIAETPRLREAYLGAWQET
jgi:branched-chain amino acid transport system ATP-binding protein